MKKGSIYAPNPKTAINIFLITLPTIPDEEVENILNIERIPKVMDINPIMS
ncbi:hypothetical protein HMPREF1982_02083 [Clostridiales bacterium oral taxon 876 str. F0540]|nr:hypothetical protein HMPREF1982_02083 [Clostridiales bacterium oral taxon 876 str. F0540]